MEKKVRGGSRRSKRFEPKEEREEEEMSWKRRRGGKEFRVEQGVKGQSES